MGKRPAGPLGVTRLGRALLDLCFEPLGCPVCGREGRGLCPPCQSELAPWGAFSHEGLTGCALLHYHGVARQLMYRYKQQRSWEACRALTGILDDWLEEAQWPLDDWDVIVPVPSSPGRVRRRGFDPALRLARHLSARSGLPLCAALDHHGDQEQKRLGRRDRQSASRLAIQLNHRHLADLQGKRILIFDDIMTTGNTLSAAAGQLRAVNPEALGFLVLERATR